MPELMLAMTRAEWERIVSAADCGVGVLDPEYQPATMDAISKLEKQLLRADECE